MENQMNFDLARARSPHSRTNKLGRVLWGMVWILLFRLSPRLCYGWRRFLLRLFGARLGKKARIDNSVRIWAPWNLEVGDHSLIGHHVDCYCLSPVTIGNNSIISQYTFLCTGSHDYTRSHFPVSSAPIQIGDGVWLAADVFVGPGVTVGKGAVVGARSSVFDAIEPYHLAVGSPARAIKKIAPAQTMAQEQ